jgi:hypothetical protein
LFPAGGTAGSICDCRGQSVLMKPILSCSIPEVDAALGNELVVGGKRAIPVGGHRRESGRPATWLGRA